MTEETNTALTITEAVSGLAKYTPEELAPYEDLYEQMTAAPEGAEESYRGWRAEIVKIMTGTTRDDAKPGDAREGDIWSNGNILWSATTHGPGKPWLFLPVYHWQSRARFRKGENQPSCKSIDCVQNVEGTLLCKDCPDEPFKHGSPTDCQNTENFIVVAHDLSGIYHLTFSKTSAKAGKNILKGMRQSKSLWAKVWGLTSVKITNPNYSWYTYNTASYASTVIPPHMDEFCRFVYNEFKEVRERQLNSMQERQAQVEALLSGSIQGDASAILGDSQEAEGFEDIM